MVNYNMSVFCTGPNQDTNTEQCQGYLPGSTTSLTIIKSTQFPPPGEGEGIRETDLGTIMYGRQTFTSYEKCHLCFLRYCEQEGQSQTLLSALTIVKKIQLKGSLEIVW